MSVDPEQSRKDKKSAGVSPSGAVLLTRAEAAALLRCSVSSIRRLEGDTLHPVVGVDGVHMFDPVELIRVASDRFASAVDTSKEGERDAQVFEALDEGKGMREIVTSMRLPVDVATKLHAAWLKMGDSHDMILSGERLGRLRAALQSDLKRPGDLVEAVLWLAEQHSALEIERSKLDDHLTDLLTVVGKVAAIDPRVAGIVAQLRSDVDPNLATRLDAAVSYHVNDAASVSTRSPGAAGEES